LIECVEAGSGDAGMAQPAKANEPSMEEILASIRRIIADDDATKSPPAPESSNGAASGGSFAAPASTPPAVSASPAAAPQPELKAIAPAFFSEPKSEASVDEQPVDILDLTEQMATKPASPDPAARAASAPQFRTIDGGSDVGFTEPADKPAQPIPEAPRLLSRSTSAAVDSAFNTLAQTVLVQNARTLEDLVREMLRPMLKSWLDDNLPGLVERLVRAEIERVSRGR
jgi:uncharacterized protein